MKKCEIIPLTASLVFIFFSSFYQAEAAIEKELNAQVTININWDKDDREGFMRFNFYGKLIVNEKFSSTEQLDSPRPVFIPYQFQQARATVSYVSKIIDKKPFDGGPELISIYEYSGPVKIKTDLEPGPLVINHMGSMLKQISQGLKQLGMGDMKITIPDEAENGMTDNYTFVLPTDKVHAKGKLRKYSIVCCDANGESYKKWYYEDVEKDITLGCLKLENIKIGNDGKLSGNKIWTADVALFNPALTGRKGKNTIFPNSPVEDPRGHASYRVNWAFGKQLPPQVNIQSVAFNTGENEEIALTLSELKSDSYITPPEWTEGGKNKPAALILGNKFIVKAVFKVEKGLKKAKVWAEEEVIEGDGGFGGIDEKTVDVKNGKIEAEFTIKEPQDVIGINEVRWIWKVQDQTQGKETTDIDAGVSRHKIYIIGPGPGNKILGTEYNKYVYIVRKGCEFAKGTKGGRQTFDQIWEKFKDIPGPNNKILRYSHKEKIYESPHLLKYGAGACGAWSEFFRDTTACQGILVEQITIHPAPPYNLIIVDPNLKGQNNPEPEISFTEHALNAYQGEFYDPSYHFKMTKDYHAYENRIIIAYCNSEEAYKEEFLKKLMFGNVVDFCWNKDLKKGLPHYRVFAECVSEENSHCAPNDPQLCEIVECSNRHYPPNTP